MNKAFSSLSLGMGLAALLALAPGLGIGPREGKARMRAAAAVKPVPDTARAPKAEAAEALLDQCLGERPGVGSPVLGATILTLPDPQRTRMAFWFDLRLNAVQRAFREHRFIPRAFFLPWDAQPGEERGQRVSSGYPEDDPGLIWFARERLATDPHGGPTAYHALFIVGESQSLGLNREAMRRALRLAERVKKAGDGPPIAILGPQFTGSLTSLGAALEEHFRNPSAPPIRVQGTTTLTADAAEALRATAGGVPPSRLSISDWVCNLSGSSKDRLLSWYMAKAGWPRDATKIALFTESNTVYTRDSRQGAQVTQILFPMGLSRLRSERRAMEQSLEKGGEAQELVLPSTLLGPSKDDGGRVLDTVPQYAQDTLRNAEHALAGTLLSLSRRGYTHIGISASDPQDLIFLAERIRAYHPSCTLFTTSGNHGLFAHPNFSHAMDGMVLFGGYPLTDSVRALSLRKGELESPVRFTSEGEYAAYYAALLLLDPARAEDPDRRFWGKQGFVSIVKGGSIWPLRHGGLEVARDGALTWDSEVEGQYRDAAAQSPDFAQYVHSRLLQLTLLLAALGITSWFVFLKPLLEVAGLAPSEPGLWPYRNLAAGAVLALATLTFLAVGYLLPLAVLRESRWHDPFLWTSVAAWSLSAALTVRVLRGRSRSIPSILLILLALAPAFLMAVWGSSHFLVFVPTYLRFTSPGRGVSLIPALVAVVAGHALLLRTWFDVRRQDHDAVWPVPLGIDHGKVLVMRHLRGLQFQPWTFGIMAALASLQLALPGGFIRSMMEVEGVTLAALTAGVALFTASLFLFWQFHQGWMDLRRLLEELYCSAYRDAFAEAGRLINWNAMRALGHGLKTHRSSQRGREVLLAQEDWVSKVDPDFPACLAELEAIELGTPDARRSHSEYEKWRFRQAMARQMTACGDALYAACAKAPSEARARQADVDLCLAMRATHFIRQAFRVARHLLTGSLGTMTLLVLGAAAFDFQPKGTVLTILGTALLGMSTWVALAIFHIQRDPLLRLMEEPEADGSGISPGLVMNGFRYVLLPMLLLLASLNPSFGELMVKLFNPLMQVMK